MDAAKEAKIKESIELGKTLNAEQKRLQRQAKKTSKKNKQNVSEENTEIPIANQNTVNIKSPTEFPIQSGNVKVVACDKTQITDCQTSGNGTNHSSGFKPSQIVLTPKSKQDSNINNILEDRRNSETLQLDNVRAQKLLVKKLNKDGVPMRKSRLKKMNMFTHLLQYEKSFNITKNLSFSANSSLHSAFISLGLKYAEGIITGSNSRCIALLATLLKFLESYRTPSSGEVKRELESRLNVNIMFLQQCRPSSVSMGNAIKYLKHRISQLPNGVSDEDAKDTLKNSVSKYYEEKILLAGEAISELAYDKIRDGDVILVYACSSLIFDVLTYAQKKDKKFKVIVVDGRPKMEGKEMLRRLVAQKIECSYCLITSVSYIIHTVTKVMLGAHALLANGYVMSRIGCSLIAMVAKSVNVPVLVCCETHKFCERVQTDTFVNNEISDPSNLVVKGTGIDNWQDIPNLYLLNLCYDITPAEFITMVITELGMLPCTSVPVVLRVKYAELG